MSAVKAPMRATVSRATRFAGKVLLPADKSIAHRAALFASISEGCSTIHNFPNSSDPQSTLSCLRQLGVSIDRSSDNTVKIQGVGRSGFRAPDAPIDCGNSGTTMRLLSGMLAGQPFESELIGDDSLTSRPMNRIAQPLQAMGARISLTDGHAPIRIQPSTGLEAIDYRLPVASAQVKSCILLAGLWARGTTMVRESIPTRDHTERMLKLPVCSDPDLGTLITSSASHPMASGTMTLPGDFSAAAFILIATSIAGTGPVHLLNVGLNPSRTGFLNVLRNMGASIEVLPQTNAKDEPTGTLIAQRAPLQGITIKRSEVPNMIDEIPILGVAGAFANGTTVVRHARELRYKECDRIHATVTNLAKLGAAIDEHEDGFSITGSRPLTGSSLFSYHDHRIAMAMGVAGLGAHGTTTIEDADAASVSFPGFWDVITQLQQ